MTNHRVYQELAYRNEVSKTKFRGSITSSLPSPHAVLAQIFSIHFPQYPGAWYRLIGKLFDRVDYFNCRAASLHSIPVSDVWRAKDTLTLSYYLVTDLQPCSEYEFKVQVLLLGRQPGPFSDTITAETTQVSKFFIFVHLISPHSRCQSQKR